jgi:hypothetical protein
VAGFGPLPLPALRHGSGGAEEAAVKVSVAVYIGAAVGLVGYISVLFMGWV